MEKSKVAIIRNTEIPDAHQIARMLDKLMRHLGGMEAFVKKGDSVTIKGNFFAPFPPPVTVDRRVVAALIKAVYKAGASHVILCEAVSIGTKKARNTTTAAVIDHLGVKKAAIEAGAEVLCLEDDERVAVKIPNGVSIGEIMYPRSMLDCDVLINLPCMKTHSMTMVSLGLKNYQGILNDGQKYYADRDDLEQKLVDVQKVRKTNLTIIDGLIAMEGNGSGESGTPHIMNMLIASDDVVAADAVTCACMGIEDVLDVSTTRIAQFDEIGNASLDRIEVLGDTINNVKETFCLPDTYAKPQDRYLLGVYENLDIHIGGACRQCWLLVSDAAAALSEYDQRFTLFVGTDPKIGNPIRTDLDNVIFWGDCACSTSGPLKDIRNQMLLEKKGLIAPGCPPFRPASAMLEQYLVERNLLSLDAVAESHKKSIQKFNEYYRTIDPTW